jgi:hypothetical protein
MIAALLTAGSLVTLLSKNNPDIVYPVAVFLLSAAFFSERLIYSKAQGVSIDEN